MAFSMAVKNIFYVLHCAYETRKDFFCKFCTETDNHNFRFNNQQNICVFIYIPFFHHCHLSFYSHIFLIFCARVCVSVRVCVSCYFVAKADQELELKQETREVSKRECVINIMKCYKL